MSERGSSRLFSSNRPYRRTMIFEEVFRELRSCAGTQFDGNVVEAFTALWNEGEIAP